MRGQNPYQKRFLCPQARMCPPPKSNRTDAIGVHLWSRPFCFVFSLHPGMWGQNPYQKRGPTPLGCICDQDLFVLFLVFTPKCEGKIRTKGGFCAPKRECVPKQKSCPKRKQQDRCHWGAFSKKTFVLFFGFSPECEGKIRVKGGFYSPKQKSCPKRKQQDWRHGDAFAIKTFFLVFIFEYIFCPTKIFYAPLLPSTLLGRRVCIHE